MALLFKKNQYMTSDDFSVKPALRSFVTYFNTYRFWGQRIPFKNYSEISEIINNATSGLNMLTSVYAHWKQFYCYFP